MSKLLDLMDNLGLAPVTYALHEAPADYIFATFGREGTTPQANVLYICNEENAQYFSSFPSCGIILLSDTDANQLPVSGTMLCEYCVIKPVDSIDLMCRIQECLIQSRRKTRLVELGRRIIVQKSSLGAITYNICEIIGNPIAVFDPSYKLLAIESMGRPVENKVWQIAKTQGSFPPELAEEFRSAIGSRDIAKAPFLCTTHAWVDMHCLVMQLISKSGKLLGSIAVYEAFRPFTPEDVSIVIDTAALLSEVLDAAVFDPCQKSSISDLFKDLVDGKPLEPEEICRRAKACSWEKYSLYQVGYIQLDDDQTKQRQCEYFCGSISKISEQVVAITRQKNIVVLIGGNDQYQMHNLVEDIIPMLEKNGLTMGLCGCFMALDETRHMFKQVREALYLGKKIIGTQTVYQAKDVSFYTLIQNLAPQHVRRLYETTFYCVIKDFDFKQQTNYCETLVLYFSNMFRSSQTAEKLHIHKNSLLYRLNRISSLFGLSFDSFHDVFNFWLGYKLSIYLDFLDREKQ